MFKQSYDVLQTKDSGYLKALYLKLATDLDRTRDSMGVKEVGVFVNCFLKVRGGLVQTDECDLQIKVLVDQLCQMQGLSPQDFLKNLLKMLSTRSGSTYPQFTHKSRAYVA